MAYGDKRDYPKIDIYLKSDSQLGHRYLASTTWVKTCREAKEHYAKSNPQYEVSQLIAEFSE